jgi:hypothetical protein
MIPKYIAIFNAHDALSPPFNCSLFPSPYKIPPDITTIIDNLRFSMKNIVNQLLHQLPG